MTIAALLVIAVPGVSSAEPDAVIFTRGSLYIPGDTTGPTSVVVLEGQTLSFTNLDTAAHSVTSDDLKPDGTLLFDSGSQSFRATAPVIGVPQLPPGTYGFHCDIHTMSGRLVVVDR